MAGISSPPPATATPTSSPMMRRPSSSPLKRTPGPASGSKQRPSSSKPRSSGGGSTSSLSLLVTPSLRPSVEALDETDRKMFGRFVAAGSTDSFEWPASEERGDEPLRWRRTLARRNRNALAVAKLDVAARTSLVNRPGSTSHVRSVSSLPGLHSTSSSTASLLPTSSLRQSYSVQTLTLGNAPARRRFDFTFSPSSLNAETTHTSWRPRHEPSPLLHLSIGSGNALNRSSERAFGCRPLVRHARPPPPTEPPRTRPPMPPPPAPAPSHSASPERERAAPPDVQPSDLLSRAIEQSSITGEEHYLAFVRERTAREPLLTVMSDDEGEGGDEEVPLEEVYLGS